ERLAVQLRALAGLAQVEVRDDEAYVGGGSLPDQPLQTVVVVVRPSERSDADVAARLRLGDPAVMARVREGKGLFDLRTVFERDESDLVEAIRRSIQVG